MESPLSPPPTSFDILARDVVENPYPFYASLRAHAPVWEIPDTGVWLVSSPTLIAEALARDTDFSANLTGLVIRGSNGRPAVFELPLARGSNDALATADDPEHALHRRLVQPRLLASRLAEAEPEMRAWTAARLRPLLEAGGGDFARIVAEPIPVLMVARLLGLPGTDLDRLLGWAMTGGELLAGTADLARMTQLMTETARLHAYLDHHLDAALAAPPANLLGDLAQAVRDGQLDRDHARGILVVLVGAGGESTASLIGSATRLVASDPALQATLRADPAALPTFVEEVVRLESPFKGHYRVVRHPTTLGDQVLPAGHRLLLLWAAANRDAATFAEPDTIDLTRRVPRQHLGFGRGIHFCVGAPLARLEARVVLEELLARTSDVALDAARPPVHIPSIFVRRLAHLHLRLR